MQQANANNISVIRIFQLDVLNNKNSWLDKNVLPKLTKRDKPENHYITIDKRYTLYDKHKELMESPVILN